MSRRKRRSRIGSAESVIASAAKQSISPQQERMDCRVASLLAMTWIGRNMTSRSRGAMRPKFCISLALGNQRAQGRPDARCTRGLTCVLRRIWRSPGSSFLPSLRAQAKQSIVRHKERMDCFVAALLAMTWIGRGRQFTALLTTTSISLAPGRLKADDSTDFSCVGSVTLVASRPSDFAKAVKSTGGSLKSMPT